MIEKRISLCGAKKAAEFLKTIECPSEEKRIDCKAAEIFRMTE